MTRILLLGANGQLGRTLLRTRALHALGNVMATSRKGLCEGRVTERVDLTDLPDVQALLERTTPDIIINAAAYTSVDRAEGEEALAMRVNGEAVGTIGEWASRHDALVVHYSTDYVFDGTQATPYAWNDTPRPINAYGRSKRAGEQLLLASGAASMILRIAWVFSAHGHNFLRSMLRLASERDEIAVVADQHGAPTSTQLIAEGTCQALTRWLASPPGTRAGLQGVHHLAARGETTWHDFAKAIIEGAARRGLIDHPTRIRSIRSIDYPTPAARPERSLLDTRRFCRLFDFQPRHWRDELDAILAQMT